jgi:hypothetical protein
VDAACSTADSERERCRISTVLRLLLTWLRCQVITLYTTVMCAKTGAMKTLIP